VIVISFEGERWCLMGEWCNVEHSRDLDLLERIENFGKRKLAKNFVHIFSARSSFSFLPYTSAVIALVVCAGV
jgi:hypothetical protein